MCDRYKIGLLYYVEWWPTDSRPDTAFNAPSSALQATRTTLRKAFGVQATAEGSNPPTVVWVTRNGTNARKVLNEDAVLESLSQRLPGAQVVWWHGTEGMARAASLFGLADAVVGPHGAGLSNIIFCNKCNVIELALESSQMRYFGHLAVALGLKYTALNVMPHFRQDAIVDVKRVVDVVAQALQ